MNGQRVIDKQTEHTIALANHTASLDRLEKGQERQREVLDEILRILRGGESAGG